MSNLTEHLVISELNITKVIPENAFDGLAVVDFEEWRPLYRYNPGKKQVCMTVWLVCNCRKEHSSIQSITPNSYLKLLRAVIKYDLRQNSSRKIRANWGLQDGSAQLIVTVYLLVLYNVLLVQWPSWGLEKFAEGAVSAFFLLLFCTSRLPCYLSFFLKNLHPFNDMMP